MAQKTVWILGSGFSKALGGPLLVDLLSERNNGESKARLKEIASVYYTGKKRLLGDIKAGEEAPDFGLVYKIFSEHLRGAEQSKGNAVHWDHAEEYLTFVDSTSSDSARREILRQWLPNEHKSEDGVTWFRRRVVQAIAAECTFAETASVKEDEAWSPYISWGRRLKAEDAIITFNYDTVLEKLGDSKEAPRISRRGVLHPGTGAESGYVPIYKLHGSVDWFFDSGGQVRQSENFLTAANGGLSPLMGTPGISKRTVRDRFLATIWDQAFRVLQDADVIVFLGYRSPPSDPDARTFIMNAISTPEGANHAPRHRRVHLVLGPNTNDPAVTRLDKLIEFSMGPTGQIKRYVLGHGKSTPRYEVIRQPLYVEDFLCGYPDSELYGTDPADD